MAFPRKPSRSAFTLVELLVVLGVMALFVGVFATALRPGNPTVAVEGAQAQLASLLTQTRGVALLERSHARLIINNNPDNPDRYLRFAGIVYDANEDGDNDPETDPDWRPATDGISLPNGVFFVPPGAEIVPESEIPWNPDVESRFSSNSTENFEYISNTDEPYYYVEFRPNGTVPQTASPGGSPIVSVSTGQPRSDGTGVLFDNPKATRGAIVRQYGSFVLLNGTEAFPKKNR